MNAQSSSPPPKRIKLESPTSPSVGENLDPPGENSPGKTPINENDEPENDCSICLQPIDNRTVIPTCSHEFCFDCLVVWSEQSRRCPLCSQTIGGYVIHTIRSRYDFRKHFLAPLRTSPIPPQVLLRAPEIRNIRRRRTARERERERRVREEREESEKLERSISRRRRIYEHDLYAKHVASNSYTRYRPYPTPPQFSASTEYISRTTTFLRRELQVWDDLDVEFLTTFIISLMKSIDIRSESAVKLLAEFLDMDAPYVDGGRHVNAEHFAHEVYSYVRSPFRDLFVYDTVVQYDNVQEAPLSEQQRSRQWHEFSQSPRRLTRCWSSESERSLSWSPSGRTYESVSERRPGVSAPSGRSRRHSKGRRDDPDASFRSSQAEYQVGPATDEDDPHGIFRNRMEIAKGKERAHSDSFTRTNGIVPVTELEKYQPAETIDVQNSHSPSQLMTSAASKPPPDQRPPRNRSLLESVQAHLAPGSRRRSAGTGAEAEKGLQNIGVDPDSQSSHRKFSTAPSLLADSERDFWVAPVPESSSLMPSRSAFSNFSEYPTSARDGSLKVTASMSAAEIMARTRARMAKHDHHSTSNSLASSQSQGRNLSSALPDGCEGMSPTTPVQAHIGTVEAQETLARNSNSSEPSSGEHTLRLRSIDKGSLTHMSGACDSAAPISAHQPECPVHQFTVSDISANLPHQVPQNHTHYPHVRLDASGRSNSIESESPVKPAFINGSHPPTLDARTRLLAKLEQEKNQARDTDSNVVTEKFPAMSDLDRTFLKSDSRSPVTPIPSTASDNSDPQTIEARLRMRAQLRVRLAAEKKNHKSRAD